nr:MAG TPA: hypothetical protein [Caudoviricetes sp.]
MKANNGIPSLMVGKCKFDSCLGNDANQGG